MNPKMRVVVDAMALFLPILFRKNELFPHKAGFLDSAYFI
jgi:hypothetical protein